METLPLPTLFYCLVAFSTFLEFCIAADTLSPGQSISGVQTLISSNQTFELGFFPSDNNKSRYLGIWYKKTPDVLVWIANQNNPLTDVSGVFTISNNCTLILLNQRNDTIWDSNSSKAAQTPIAQLLDSGNLVLKDNLTSSSEDYLWKSFDYPLNSWLPGMTIGKDTSNGLDRFLTCCRDSDIASPGDFTYKFDYKGLPQMFLKSGSKKLYRTGPWNGVRFSGLPMFLDQWFSPIFSSNKELLGYKYNPPINYIWLTLSYPGGLELTMLMEGSTKLSPPRFGGDKCDIYALCGANSVCRSFNDPACECLEGFTPNSPEEWKLLNYSSGCVSRTPLECQRKDEFMILKHVKLPDLLEFWLNKSMSTNECKAECLKNCSCTAYANSDISGGGSGCLIWFEDLIDIKGYSKDNESLGQDIYIRLPASELSKCTCLLYNTVYSYVLNSFRTYSGLGAK